MLQMTTWRNTGMIVLVAGVALHAGAACAALSTHISDSNAVNYCQAFTPGISNTIRNRVIGSQNVGTSALAVACNYATVTNTNDSSDQTMGAIYQVFANGSKSEVTISCTLLTGTPGGDYFGDVYSSTRTLQLAPGAVDYIQFTGEDNPTPGASLNSTMVGVNCLLPPKVTMTEVELVWTAEDGIGT
jgi:hypothetical protein